MPAAPESSQPRRKPLAPVLVGLAMFLFFPLGLYLLWRHPTLGKNAKWWASGIAWACLLMLFSGREEKGGEGRPVKTETTSVETPTDTGRQAKTENAAPVVEKPDNSATVGSSGSRPPPKKSNRKAPQIKIKLDDRQPEVQEAYKDGFDAGIALAYAWLDDIESKAGGTDIKKYINAHPVVSAALEEERMSMLKQIGDSAGNLGRTIADLASRGVAKNLNKHPSVIEADRSHHFILGKSHSFNAIIDPLLKD